VGFWLAVILSRILYNWERLDHYNLGLKGKISGPVGVHNAQFGLGFVKKQDKKSFEEKLLSRLNLKPASISTQILPPEPLAFYLYSAVCLSATLGQFGRDCRHLMRSEIGEIVESFEEGQVGSSTMAHKRNPINFENMEGMWLRTKNEFGKVLDTLVSEHQRDLVGSSVARDYPIILINLQYQLNTLLRKNKSGQSFLERISVNKKACEKNFSINSNVILAEPLYIALQMAGYKEDAHELVNHVIVKKAQEKGMVMMDVLEELAEEDSALKKVVNNIPSEFISLLRQPENYIGDANELATEVALRAKDLLTKFK
jgi:adenylosuccinate lyase